MTGNTRQGVEQGRASKAYEFAQAGKNLDGGEKPNKEGKLEDSRAAKDYKSYAKKIPMMIKTNGLGATLAFIRSKPSKLAYKKLYEQLTEWFESNQTYLMPEFRQMNNKSEELAHHVVKLDSFSYRAATVETLALFGWIRRFAEGLIQGESDGE